MNNTNNRGYFNSAQALADYAEILLHIKKTHDATYSPVIVVGGSYGGGKLSTRLNLCQLCGLSIHLNAEVVCMIN